MYIPLPLYVYTSFFSPLFPFSIFHFSFSLPPFQLIICKCRAVRQSFWERSEGFCVFCRIFVEEEGKDSTFYALF